MPRNGSDIYFIPPGTEGFPDTTIESAKYNTYIHDVEEDLNRVRPIIAGGTGANNAAEARGNLEAEVAQQNVLNYDTHTWESGSFYSQGGATGNPVAGHLFSGTCLITGHNPDFITIEARDQSDALKPGRKYIREKRNGVWDVWRSDSTGVASDTPPENLPENSLWWDTEGGQLYFHYDDGNSKQWVIASPVPDPAQFLLKAGDKMEGTLELQAPPVTDLQAANKKYVDDSAPPPFPAGTVMLFVNSAAPTGWTRSTGYNDRVLRISDGAVSYGGATGLSGIITQTATGGHNLTAIEQASMPVTGSFTGNGSGSGQPVAPQTWIAGAGGPGTGGGLVGGFSTGIDPCGVSVFVTVNGTISGTATGSGGGHSHPINLNIAYADVLMAIKD